MSHGNSPEKELTSLRKPNKINIIIIGFLRDIFNESRFKSGGVYYFKGGYYDE